MCKEICLVPLLWKLLNLLLISLLIRDSKWTGFSQKGEILCTFRRVHHAKCTLTIENTAFKHSLNKAASIEKPYTLQLTHCSLDLPVFGVLLRFSPKMPTQHQQIWADAARDAFLLENTQIPHTISPDHYIISRHASNERNAFLSIHIIYKSSRQVLTHSLVHVRCPFYCRIIIFSKLDLFT